MITITTQGKTYQIVDLKGRIKSTIEEWVSAWYLEEVKENKEPQFYVWDIDISTGKPFKSGSTTQTFSTIKDQTILEKLREELERRIIHWSSVPVKQNCYKDILELLTSLETKEEPQPQEDIDLLPKFKNIPSTPTDDFIFSYAQDIWKQVELLTNAVNQLIKANKK